MWRYIDSMLLEGTFLKLKIDTTKNPAAFEKVINMALHVSPIFGGWRFHSSQLL